MYKKIAYVFLTALLTLACQLSTVAAGVDTSNDVKRPIITIPTMQPDVIVTTRQMVVTADTLRVRQEPSTGADEIAVLSRGDIITVGLVVETTNPDCGKWVAMTAPNGWVCLAFVEAVK